jgi:light-regulated signal transduction histidine kinase (bacteriophytochrome)
MLPPRTGVPRIPIPASSEIQRTRSQANTSAGVETSDLDEYHQVKGSDTEGKGLGLSITKRFAELLGGTIGIESDVEKGSTFTVRIPAIYDSGCRD